MVKLFCPNCKEETEEPFTTVVELDPSTNEFYFECKHCNEEHSYMV